MSNWAEIVVYTVKDERKKYFHIDKLFLGDVICFVGCSIVVLLWLFNVYLLKNNISLILLLASLFGSLVFGFRIIKYIKKNPYNPTNHSEFMIVVKTRVESLGVNTREIVDELILELDEEIKALNENEKKLTSTVSKAFFWVFWTPFAFLTKYVIENNILEILTPEDYFALAGTLFVVFLFCLLILISNINLFESTNYFRKTTVKEAIMTLKDIRYLYNEDMNNALQSINSQATADAAPQC